VCDPIVGTSKDTILKIASGRTKVVLNTHTTPTAQFVKDTQWRDPSDKCKENLLESLAGVQNDLGDFDAYHLAMSELGDSIFVNPLVLGYAWQKGWIPLRRESIIRAIELNAVSVEKNTLAFEIGRRAAIDESIQANKNKSEYKIISFSQKDKFSTLLPNRIKRLVEYQNKAYADTYKSFVEEANKKLGEKIATVVAKNLYKLMAYKDEYEVARLHLSSAFNDRIQQMFEGNYTVNYHLAPPLLAKRNEKGELIKQKMRPHITWVFKLLASLKGLRATPLDIFGYTSERQMERLLIEQYKTSIQELMNSKQGEGFNELALKIASIPESIKGYGHVKERAVEQAQQKWSELTQALREHNTRN
jgi:indolepyruvate ferredoxin oxidoreductase